MRRVRKRGAPRLVSCVAVFALGLVLASPAHAQQAPPSAVAQYAESVPSSSGPTAPGAKQEKRTPLPRESTDALKEALPEVAAPLEKIATSSSYGAPTAPRKPEPSPQPPLRAPESVPTGISLDTTLGSTVGALGSASDAQILGMLLAILLTTLAAVALAVGRARAVDRAT